MNYLVILIAIFVVYRSYRLFFAPDEWDKTKVKESFQKDTKVIIFTAYDLKFSTKPYVTKNKEILQKYADIHGHEYKMVIDYDNELSPYWLRVKVLKELLENTKDGSIIAYFDADAVPSHMDVSITDFISSLKSSADIFISEDPDIEWNPVYPGVFNTGVFFCRNSPRSRDFVNQWFSMYKPEGWIKDSSNKWTCKFPCLYAGENYEQGAFSKLYKSSDKNLIQRLNYTTLACSKSSSKCFALHLMGASDIKRDMIFEDMLKK
jgi:hypothetical protein